MSRQAQKPTGERRVLARGAVGVDPRAALAKLREFMLPDPALYVAELVRAAVELKATKIIVDNSAKDFILTCECEADPLDPALIVRLFEQLFANDARAVRLLAIATNTALGLRPRFVDIYTTTPGEKPANGVAAGSIARVRFLPTPEGASNDEIELDGKLEYVARPEAMPTHGLRVHVRERFGTSVLREWFSEPVESKVLRTRCMLVGVPLVRAVDGKPLDRGEPPTVIARVSLGEKLRGELGLLRANDREVDVIDFYEQGVLLSRESLVGGGESAPNLRAYVDEKQLQTNVSRSAVDRSGPFGRQLSRALADARVRLVKAAVQELSGPFGADIAMALRALILRRLGTDWVTIVRRGNTSGEEGYLEPALQAPLIPMVTGKSRSLAQLAALENGEVMIYSESALPSAALAPWLDAVAHATDETIARLLEPLEPASAEVALAQAEESHARYTKFFGHSPREPRLSGDNRDELIRIPIGKSTNEARAHAPTIELDGQRAIGELAIDRPTGFERAMELTVFIDGRPLPPTAETPAPLFIRAVLQRPELEPRSDFSGPQRNAALNQSVARLREAAFDGLLFVANFLADPKAMKVDDRVHWIGPAAHKLSQRDRAFVITTALAALTEKRSGAMARTRINKALAEYPALTTASIFRTTNNKYFSIQELRATLAQSNGALLFTSAELPTLTHAALPVFVLDTTLRELVLHLVDRVDFVDYTRFGARNGETLQGLVSRDDPNAAPWLEIVGAGARALITVAPRNGHLAVLHRGQVLVQSAESGALGRCLVRIEDEGLIPISGREWSRTSFSDEARKIYDEAQFDLLYALLRAIGGDRRAMLSLGITGTFSPPQHILSFIFVSAARLSAMPPDTERGTLTRVTHGALARLCNELPLVLVQTQSGPKRFSLAELRAKAKQQPGPLLTLESAPSDVDYDASFEPIIVSRGEFEAALAVGIGAKLQAAESQLPARRDARKHRVALEAFARKPKVDFDDLSEFSASDIVRVEHDNYTCVVGLLPVPQRARFQVVFDGRVAVSGELSATDLADCPVIARVRITEAQKYLAPSLDALASAGNGLMTAALKRALKKLVEEVAKRADGTRDPGAAARELIAAYCADAGRVDDKLRAKVSRAVLWKAVPTGLASIDQFAAHGRGRVPFVTKEFDGWIKAPDGETDPVAAYLAPTPDAPREAKDAAQAARKRTLSALEYIATLAPKDATEEFERLQRARRLLRSAKENIVLSGLVAHPALATRIEAQDNKLGVGELRLTTSGTPGLALHLFYNGNAVRVVRQNAPISLAVAIESSMLTTDQVRMGEPPDALTNRLISIARKTIVEAMKAHETLPSWSLPAQRWALLSGGATTKSLKERPVFQDTLGKPMSIADLDAQQKQFGHVSYSTDPPGVDLEPLDEGRRVWRTTEHEASWLTGARVPMNYTEPLREEQRAFARRRMERARRIVIRETLTAETPVFELTVAKHEFEGEVALLASRQAPIAKVYLWQDRKPLGETNVPAPWPSLVALDVAELTPNRSETAAIEDAAFHRTRARVAELVRLALDAQFQEPAGVLAMIRSDRGGSPAIRGGRVRVFGKLWLLADPLEPGRIDVREPGERAVRAYDTRTATQTSRVRGLPVGGLIWFNQSEDDDPPLAHQVAELVKWAYRALLGQLVSAKQPGDAVFSHMAYAAAARVIDTDTLKTWAKDRLLPETCTSFARLQDHFADGKTLDLCPEGDARAVQERFVVARSDARWFATLEALSLIQVAAAAPTPPTQAPQAPAKGADAPVSPVVVSRVTEPAVEPKSSAPKPQAPPKAQKRSEPTLGDHVLGFLRRHGVVERDLVSIAVDNGPDAGTLATYDKGKATAVVFARHAVVARLLTGQDPTRAHKVLAIAVLGEMNRAVQRFTDADEARVMGSMLLELSGTVL
ncbi:MAG: hypothetical protein JNK05_16440 [Myxococcales bacterium]|nr:hypothetical protein [Myxococcales bacterium]